jgi:hypothetical protein
MTLQDKSFQSSVALITIKLDQGDSMELLIRKNQLEVKNVMTSGSYDVSKTRKTQ